MAYLPRRAKTNTVVRDEILQKFEPSLSLRQPSHISHRSHTLFQSCQRALSEVVLSKKVPFKGQFTAKTFCLYWQPEDNFPGTTPESRWESWSTGIGIRIPLTYHHSITSTEQIKRLIISADSQHPGLTTHFANVSRYASRICQTSTQ